MPAVPDEAPADRFDAWRNADERQFLSFMIVLDAVRERPVDLVLADAAWGIDHHLHENPELKGWAYAWLGDADAVAWHPEPEADDRRRHLMADANAEMLEQAQRYSRIRDRSIAFGSIDDVPDVPPDRGCRRRAAGRPGGSSLRPRRIRRRLSSPNGWPSFSEPRPCGRRHLRDGTEHGVAIMRA